MAVLVEGISVVVRAGAVVEKFAGGGKAFLAECPPDTLCADGEVVRVGFMHPDDAQHFVSTLTSKGLTYRAHGEAVDLVIVDQQRGLSAPCKWIELEGLPAPGAESETVLACRRVGSEQQSLVTPEEWSYENSLSERFGPREDDSVAERFEFVRQEDTHDVYRDPETGEEVFVDRIRGQTE